MTPTIGQTHGRSNALRSMRRSAMYLAVRWQLVAKDVSPPLPSVGDAYIFTCATKNCTVHCQPAV
eukprot:6901975-Alexandrium_andersonii.AAC.1